MASQHLNTSTQHLDGYLKGIRDEFDRLNYELDEIRKQRDEFITKYRSQVEELRQLRQTISSRDNNTVTDDSTSPLISPVSSSSDFFSSFDGEDTASDRLHNPENAKTIGHLDGERNLEGGNVRERDGSYQNGMNDTPTLTGTTSLSLHANVTPVDKLGYSVEFNGSSTASLNLNLVHTLTQGEGEKRVAYSMDGKYLAAASLSGIVSIFDSKTGERFMHSVMKDPYHVEMSLPSYTCVGFSPDNKYVATGEENGNVRIWVISQRRVRNTFRHQDIIYALNFSPNGRCIVTCSLDRTVIIWRLRDGSARVLTASDFYPWAVRFSLDGRCIASGNFMGEVRIWKVRTGKPVASRQGHSNLVRSLVFKLDGNGLLGGLLDWQVVWCDFSSLSSLGMAIPPISPMMETSHLIGPTDNITTVSISPDGKWIASGSFDCTVRIWNAHDGALHCTLHCPGSVFSVDFSPVGNSLAIGGDFEDVTIWNYLNS